jgi:hypothetical protein
MFPSSSQWVSIKFSLCPQISAPVISPGQKWWLTVLEIEISCSQWEGSACTHERSIFFLFEGGVGKQGFFGFFPLFQMCSHRVPKVFPKMFPRELGCLTHMVCPKFKLPYE